MLGFSKRKRIVDLVHGEIASVEGVVVSENDLVLLTGTPCVYFAVLQEVYRVGPRGRGRPLWYCESYHVECDGILLSDDTDKVWIASEDRRRIFVKNALQEMGRVRGRKNRRFTARFICKGDRLVVKGVVSQSSLWEPANVFMLSAPAGKDLQIVVKK